MTDYSKVAVYDVRKTIWQELLNANLFNEGDYYPDGLFSALIPIIPAQQIPEFNNLLPGKTYIVYDVIQRPTTVQWWMSEEILTFTIISRNAAEIQTISNFIVDVFRRYDKSAKEIQLQLDSDSPFRFHFFALESSDPVQAFHDEGGFMSGIVSILYAYTRDLDPDTGRIA